MLLRILFVVIILLAGVLIFAATKPSKFTIRRSVVIDAPAEKIFPLINDFHNWTRWAPQDKADMTMQRTFSGAPRGEGAVSEWRGAGSMGSGTMSITRSLPFRSVLVKVDFVKPFAVQNLNEFELEANGSATQVTWTMQGTNLYVMKLMSVFVSPDRMMGSHFETGLRNLKTVAESGS